MGAYWLAGNKTFTFSESCVRFLKKLQVASLTILTIATATITTSMPATDSLTIPQNKEKAAPTDPRPVNVYNMPELSSDERSLFGGRKEHVYGEITTEGFRKLAQACGLGPSDVFVDLGSGLGAVVLQAAEEFRVRRSCGVELAPSRHRLALAARSAAPAEVRERVVLVEGDIGASETAGLLMEKSTVLWLANLLFDGPLERRIAVLIEASPAVRCVAALRPISGGLDGFELDKAPVLCQMSWDWHDCAIYRRREESS